MREYLRLVTLVPVPFLVWGYLMICFYIVNKNLIKHIIGT